MSNWDRIMRQMQEDLERYFLVPDYLLSDGKKMKCCLCGRRIVRGELLTREEGPHVLCFVEAPVSKTIH